MTIMAWFKTGSQVFRPSPPGPLSRKQERGSLRQICYPDIEGLNHARFSTNSILSHGSHEVQRRNEWGFSAQIPSTSPARNSNTAERAEAPVYARTQFAENQPVAALERPTFFPPFLWSFKERGPPEAKENISEAVWSTMHINTSEPVNLPTTLRRHSDGFQL